MGKVMTESKLRKLMLVLHLEGLSKVEIGVRTGKSRQWVHKWIKRYEAGPETDWSQDISRRPNTVYGKTNPETERLVLEARDRLARTKYAQIGAVGIQYELSKPGLLAAVPPTSTIDRILKRNGRIPLGQKSTSKKKITHPSISALTRWIWWGRDISRVRHDFTAST
ncbi:MAG: helix-turn-helix domain-containing protein [Bacteroidetes bacterium]|nr:helix-turn-helix domain-containing protein [Bacteroidota bacterium]